MGPPTTAAAPPSREIRVWDVPVRAVHWVQAGLVAVSVTTGFTGGNTLRLHRLSGYAILTLVLFRLAWGFVGGHHARFTSFLRGPRAILAFARETVALRRPLHAGHNPLAGWGVLAMILALLVQASTGLFANDDIFFEGPLAGVIAKDLSDELTGIHKANARILLGLVGLHLGAVLFHSVVERQSLVAPMFTGRKRWPHESDVRESGRGRPLLAAALFLAAVAAVALVVNAPGLGRTGGAP